jgi:tetratricopeptide (TPR) repeat protein
MSLTSRPQPSNDPETRESGDDAGRWYSTSILASLICVPPARIRSWQRLGLLKPDSVENGAARFGFQQLATARQISRLVDHGVSATTLHRHFQRLQQHSPRANLSDYSISASGSKILFRRNGETVDRCGQMLFDFECGPGTLADSHPIPILRSLGIGASPQEIPDMATLREIAANHEDAGEIREAIDALRTVLLAGGPEAQTNFHLGELLYLHGDTSAARERYSMALELDPQLVEVCNSLGVLFHETGETELAIATLQGALSQQEDYPDTHYHLALALEAAGRISEARAHWQRYLDLAPASPWSDIANSRLNAESP